MLVFGTQMHLITFLFICIETVVLFYLVIYRLARPDDKNTFRNIILIGLLIFYNLTGGLLPDENLPGSYSLQMSIAYYLEKMKFHAYKGVFIFLITPYIIFVFLFLSTGNIETAKKLLIIPTVYAVWVIFTLIKAVRYKYKNSFRTKAAKEEMAVTFLSLTPWVSLPVIDYFNLGQAVEATTTNTGFLLLLALQLKQHIAMVKAEHQQLIESKEKLLGWNEKLLTEVEKRTREIERLSTDKRILEGCRQYQLTNREREIASLICRGSSYKQIAESLFIAERTVTKHVQNIFDKVEVCNKLELLNKLSTLAVN
jgi:DNA-binding CsgD family transcriptional regulator